MRVSVENLDTVRSLGVSTDRIVVLRFAISAILAGVLFESLDGTDSHYSRTDVIQSMALLQTRSDGMAVHAPR